jgi:hypothetical protein
MIPAGICPGFNVDKLVKSGKGPFFVIPADPGSGPGQAPESSIFKELQKTWTPFFNGVTIFWIVQLRSLKGELLNLGA